MTSSPRPTPTPRRALAILVSAAGVVVASVLLAPPIHALLPFPFHVVFKRLLTIGALIVLVAFVRVRRETFVQCGLAWRQDSRRMVAAGVVAGLAGLAALVCANLVWGNAAPAVRQFSAGKWAVTITGGVLTGVLIGPIEEFVFRGVLFGWLRDRVCRGRVLPGMVATSALYALLHFLDVRRPAIGSTPGFADGLRLVAAPFQAFGHWDTLWPAAVGLFLFGLVLNTLAVRTASLYASIGLHTGCVVFLRIVVYMVTFEQADVFWWGTRKIYDGVAGWMAIVLIGAALTMTLAPPSGTTEKRTNR
jgi:membrane protease YdiL (CAAX protease family)